MCLTVRRQQQLFNFILVDLLLINNCMWKFVNHTWLTIIWGHAQKYKKNVKRIFCTDFFPRPKYGITIFSSVYMFLNITIVIIILLSRVNIKTVLCIQSVRKLNKVAYFFSFTIINLHNNNQRQITILYESFSFWPFQTNNEHARSFIFQIAANGQRPFNKPNKNATENSPDLHRNCLI